MIQRFAESTEDGTPWSRTNRSDAWAHRKRSQPPFLLCADAASFTTGHAMVVDGGQSV